MTLFLRTRLILQQPLFYLRPVFFQNGIGLPFPSFVLRDFPLKHFPDGYAGMPRVLLYLADTLAVNSMRCPDILILFHPDHLSTSGCRFLHKETCLPEFVAGWVSFGLSQPPISRTASCNLRILSCCAVSLFSFRV